MADNKPDMGSDNPYYKRRMALMISNPDAPGYAVTWASDHAKARFDKYRERHNVKCRQCGVILYSAEDGPFKPEQLLAYGIPPICMHCAGEDPEIEVD